MRSKLFVAKEKQFELGSYKNSSLAKCSPQEKSKKKNKNKRQKYEDERKRKIKGKKKKKMLGSS